MIPAVWYCWAEEFFGVLFTVHTSCEVIQLSAIHVRSRGVKSMGR